MKINFENNRLFSNEEQRLAACIDKILGALGLAMKARGLAVGSDAVSMAVSSGKARLVFITSDISENSKDKILSKLYFSEQHNSSSDTSVKYIVLPCTMAELAHRLGKSGLTSTVALTKAGFEKIIFKCMGVDSKSQKSLDNTTEVHK